MFEGKRGARRALDELEGRSVIHGWFEDVAVLSRSRTGILSIHSVWAQDDTAVGSGASWGMITGALLGLLSAPGGVLADAATGGSLAAMVPPGRGVVLEDPHLSRFAAALRKDTSALVLAGELPSLAEFEGIFDPDGGQSIRAELTNEDVQAIRNAVSAHA